MTQPIPDGFCSVTPSFIFKDSAKAMDFYEKAFGARRLDVMPNLNGEGVMHATIKIGDCLLMMGDESASPNCPSAETLGGSPISLYLYVSDADAVFNQAVAAGGTVIMPVTEMFWGDRAGTVQDPFGYQWMIATHTRNLTKEQVRAGAEVFFEANARRSPNP